MNASQNCQQLEVSTIGAAFSTRAATSKVCSLLAVNMCCAESSAAGVLEPVAVRSLLQGHKTKFAAATIEQIVHTAVGRSCKLCTHKTGSIDRESFVRCVTDACTPNQDDETWWRTTLCASMFNKCPCCERAAGHSSSAAVHPATDEGSMKMLKNTLAAPYSEVAGAGKRPSFATSRGNTLEPTATDAYKIPEIAGASNGTCEENKNM